MAHYYAGEEIFVRVELDDSDGDDIDPASITFEYKRGRGGSKHSVTPTELATGLYEASFTPDRGGYYFYRWKSTTPALVKEGVIEVKHSFDDDEVVTDYGD